jgi:hypothetical protein
LEIRKEEITLFGEKVKAVVQKFEKADSIYLKII